MGNVDSQYEISQKEKNVEIFRMSQMVECQKELKFLNESVIKEEEGVREHPTDSDKGEKRKGMGNLTAKGSINSQ